MKVVMIQEEEREPVASPPQDCWSKLRKKDDILKGHVGGYPLLSDCVVLILIGPLTIL